MDMTYVLLKAIVTEKTMKESEKGKYTFLVTRNAHKKRIKHAVEKLYNVTVTNVSTIMIKGKTKRTGSKRVESKLSPLKKAMVVLKEGQMLGGSTEDKKDATEKKKK